jgi:DNA-binding transcriptional regulator YiaG
MSYNINESCFQCGSCEAVCPTGAIQLQDVEYTIDLELCNNCEGYYAEPQCIISCPTAAPTPIQAKKGRYKTVEREEISLDLFTHSSLTYFASSMVIWETCKILTNAPVLNWKTNPDQSLYYERQVKLDRGKITFRLKDGFQVNSNQPEYFSDPNQLNNIDIRAACLHLLYAAYATTLEKPWEQTFVINDQQIEQYLGLDKRKDLSKAAKLTLIKILVQQPCQIVAKIDWPQQGKIKEFSVEESPIWHLIDTKHHFQADNDGCKHLTGLTFKIQPGLWSKYFLNKQGYQKRIAFYQYGTLPKFVLNTVMSVWQQHEGMARILLWLLFKVKLGIKQGIKVSTLMNIAYGRDKVNQANLDRDQRKRLINKFESDLEALNYHQIKPIFDPETYPKEVLPLWVKLADIPDDADEAIEFWINDASQDNRLTDSSPRGKWNILMQARILQFEFPSEWSEKLTKFEQKKQRKIQKRQQSNKSLGLSGKEILDARKKQGISQRELAQLIGKSQSWIRDLENGRFAAKPEDQNQLKKILNF